MSVFRVEVRPFSDDPAVAGRLREAGLSGVQSARVVRVYVLEGALPATDVEQIAREALCDPITGEFNVLSPGSDQPQIDDTAIEVHPRPGVMDPVAETLLAELRLAGYAIDQARTAARYELDGDINRESLERVAYQTVANDCIERVVIGREPVAAAPRPAAYAFELRTVAIGEMDDRALARLSRDGGLFLTIDEMRTIQAHFRELKRDPTDLELETLAQTWSEHCVHKTLRSAFVYRGAPMPEPTWPDEPADDEPATVEIRYANLLKDTVFRATDELRKASRGPELLSIFSDNAGIVGLNRDYGVAFKVETHNHPSAIEPYGGAATGTGGVVRDILGCGLGAKPIANTDVFCVAPGDWPRDDLPAGVLHPRRVLRGIVHGVADYGNRLGIPTVNGAVVEDPRYLGNPLVFCGCVGLIPRDRIGKEARTGDHIVVIGGRTGRDGIHGATFSSAELTDTHADEFSHAVQIGNAITEKRVLDAILAARDAEGGCLFSAVTDCGAGGLSSAIGEMGAEVGAEVDLEKVPLKYVGLRYDEVWISESQERMVLAVPPARLDAFMKVMRDEDCEAAVIGEFGRTDAGEARLLTRYEGHIVGDLSMRFLHDGLPMREREATWEPMAFPSEPSVIQSGAALFEKLHQLLGAPATISRDWIIRGYDHEVQGASVVKPRGGRGAGPNDGAVIRPLLDQDLGVTLACGLAPELAAIDPYWMAANAIDEALRNTICVGGDPRRTAILDNFCWGSSADPEELGGLVRACQACYDFALAYGLPFISGKDSLNNNFALSPEDLEATIDQVKGRLAVAADDDVDMAAVAAYVARRVRDTGRLAIPGTLLISAMSAIEDVTRVTTTALQTPGATLFLIGGMPRVGFDANAALEIHYAVAEAIRNDLVAACHDVSHGGWLLAAVEMAIAGRRGIDLAPDAIRDAAPALTNLAAGYLVEARDSAAMREFLDVCGAPYVEIGAVRDDELIAMDYETTSLADLDRAWREPAPN
ncbi:MAG: phosphoribosylformylglycinamidine synthase subunit PurS [Phycisphaerales bacterium]|nr:phosphoribosylformylglycinamidine synthase subunit PurS [Phycisphaerales bacterium]